MIFLQTFANVYLTTEWHYQLEGLDANQPRTPTAPITIPTNTLVFPVATKIHPPTPIAKITPKHLIAFPPFLRTSTSKEPPKAYMLTIAPR